MRPFNPRSMRTQVWLIVTAVLLPALSACVGNPPLEIKDLTFYGSLGTSGVAIVHTLTTQTSTMSDTDWRNIWYNPGVTPMLCLSAADFAEAKREEELAC